MCVSRICLKTSFVCGNQWQRVLVAFMHPASLSDSEGVIYAFLFSLLTWMGACHFAVYLVLQHHPLLSFLSAFLNVCLLACLTQEAKPAHNPGKTRTKKKSGMMLGFHLLFHPTL
ncbi:hypothetical protein BDV23DRAFT_143617 [Aspergillus alliaceus]|uniref:Uncharacterized protein n=1 Tax=Petromyces alliaceus TaxID=209559 RepID=A0A5N7CPU0_PETAA|nr:uncharacterized protein BDW43DRAFT_269057 [Aspergillus alliaceus]KAB8236066.1 hypothetical protein BDW43DRAFT_269057 [Aspergillus alliaceus]KAE8396226.1 hypothetical protein BDV23DRAFT_143617 [Aspergillus alliaceus]